MPASDDDVVLTTLRAMMAISSDIDRELRRQSRREDLRGLVGAMRVLLDQVVELEGVAAATPCFDLFEETRERVTKLMGISAWDGPDDSNRPRPAGQGPRIHGGEGKR